MTKIMRSSSSASWAIIYSLLNVVAVCIIGIVAALWAFKNIPNLLWDIVAVVVIILALVPVIIALAKRIDRLILECQKFKNKPTVYRKEKEYESDRFSYSRIDRRN